MQDTLFTTKLTDIRTIYLNKKITEKVNVKPGEEFLICLNTVARQIILKPKKR